VRAATLALVAALGAGACKHRKNASGELTPPPNAEAWEPRYAVAFDDEYTRYDINLAGRAPNDYLDQRLFQSRLGHADFVALVKVEQVWGKGRHEGKRAEYLDVELGEVLMGDPGRGADQRQLLRVRSEDELPAALRGQIMILFVRWAPGEHPAFHHHLMPADPDVVALIQSMVRHARDEGVLSRGGEENARGKARRKRQERKTKRRGDADKPVLPVD
jgi:hypothetical protein